MGLDEQRGGRRGVAAQMGRYETMPLQVDGGDGERGETVVGEVEGLEGDERDDRFGQTREQVVREIELLERPAAPRIVRKPLRLGIL